MPDPVGSASLRLWKVPARVLRLDPFLAGDQRDIAHALDLADAVIDLARQVAERKADRSGGMRAEPFYCEVGFAGVGGAENGFHGPIVSVAASTRRQVAGHVCECGAATCAAQAAFVGYPEGRGDICRPAPTPPACGRGEVKG